MRERTKLDAGVSAVRMLERELRDNMELAELAEAEGE